MTPIRAGVLETELKETVPRKGETIPEAAPPKIADLWSLFDGAAARTIKALKRHGVSAEIVRSHSETEHRYAVRTRTGVARFITILPLVPTAHGNVTTGAFLGASDSKKAVYLKPSIEGGASAWTVAASGKKLDAAAIDHLFSRVFEEQRVPAKP